jgi:acetaldehyde dehydrogenase (acetylating)
VIEEAKKNGCYFVNEEEKKKLENVVTKNGRINPEIVGKSAKFIADYAGISVPDSTTVLLAECDKVGKDEPMSMEKLSPMLAFYVVDGWLEGCHKCIELLEFGGIGHTMVIHSNDHDIILKFALEKPAFRILVNTVASLGAVGYTTSLAPSMTLGPGTWGGSIVSENVTAKHLLNIKTLAFESTPVNSGDSISSFNEQTKVNNRSYAQSSIVDKIEENLRARAGNPILKSSSGNTDSSKTGEKTYGSGITEDEIQKIIQEFGK